MSVCFEREYPDRIFRGCKIAELNGALVARVYSDDAQLPSPIPRTFQIFRFEPDSGSLTLVKVSLLSPDDAVAFVFANYK